MILFFLPFLYSVKINKKIENPATCEVQSVIIRFLNAKNVRPAEIHRQIVEVQGEGGTNERRECEEMVFGCSKKAGLMCMTGNEVGARFWLRTI